MPSVVLVHGYSETSLAAYQNYPELLSAAGFDTIVLSAFDSLDDFVTIDDLAVSLEMRVADLEATGFDVHDVGLRLSFDRCAGRAPLDTQSPRCGAVARSRRSSGAPRHDGRRESRIELGRNR